MGNSSKFWCLHTHWWSKLKIQLLNIEQFIKQNLRELFGGQRGGGDKGIGWEGELINATSAFTKKSNPCYCWSKCKCTCSSCMSMNLSANFCLNVLFLQIWYLLWFTLILIATPLPHISIFWMSNNMPSSTLLKENLKLLMRQEFSS